MRPALLRILFGALVFAGCDYIDDPTAPGSNGGGGTGDVVKRRALLEEFTGHRCNTCPAAHAVAANLADFFGDDLIVVGVHATDFFAAPLDPPSTSYTTDFRTEAGEAYATSFEVTFLPTGLINRTPFNNSIRVSSGNWSSAIAAIVDDDAALDIWFTEVTHNALTNTVSAKVQVAVLRPLTGAHNITLYLTEDHVIDWQLNSLVPPPGDPNVEFYDHRHVLRTTLNGTLGEVLISTSAAVGDTLPASYLNVPVNPDWNAANFAAVAYVYNTATKEVLQAVERKFQP